MSSVRETAIGELRTRLENILVANGYNTDVGQDVLLGEQPVFGPDDPTAFVGRKAADLYQKGVQKLKQFP